MTDKEIIALYFKRSENAIEQTDVKYGKLCHSISINILNDTRDSEECVNDTYLTLWNKIPPKEPNPFKAYICRIIKNLSLKKYEFNHAKKRNSEYEASLDELEECVSDGTEASESVEFKELQMAIDMFLSELPEKKRILFLRRYWFLQPVKEIAKDYGITEKTASMRLSRLREKLQQYLQEKELICWIKKNCFVRLMPVRIALLGKRQKISKKENHQ